jgi:hypothetical protein
VNNEHITIAQGFRRTWTVANTLGLGAGMAIFAAIAEGIEQSGVLGSGEAGDIVGHLIGLLFAGVLFGLMQWLVLRRYVLRTGWAVLGASVGLWLGYGGGYAILGFPFDYILGPALAGLLAGSVQWLALRRQVAGAGWWVVANTFGLMLGSMVGVAIAFLGLGEAIGGNYFGWIVLNGIICGVNGAIGGAIGASVLVRLLRRTAPAAAQAALASQ